MLVHESRLQRESEQDFCEEEKSCNGRDRRDENKVVFPPKKICIEREARGNGVFVIDDENDTQKR